jgi:hypothetical protein
MSGKEQPFAPFAAAIAAEVVERLRADETLRVLRQFTQDRAPPAVDKGPAIARDRRSNRNQPRRG